LYEFKGDRNLGLREEIEREEITSLQLCLKKTRSISSRVHSADDGWMQSRVKWACLHSDRRLE
jgi:hypothetical protein